MNHHDQDRPHDPFEDRLRGGLDHLASSTSTSEPGQFDPEAWPLTHGDHAPRRMGAYLVGAAAVAALTLTGLVAISGRSDEEPAASSPSARPAPSVSHSASELPAANTSQTAVRGVPICGAELPVTVDVPAAVDTARPGPAVYGATGEGQFAQHWELPDGTIEVRWPADEREIYDLERNRGDRTAFDSMSVSTPQDGTQAIINVPAIDPGVVAEHEVPLSTEPDGDHSLGDSPATLTMTATAATPTLQPPCNIVQVRYIDLDGNQTTVGYDVTDFAAEPSFGVDLDPLIISTGDATSAPDPADTVSCGDSDIDTDVNGPDVATSAGALDAFLGSDQAPVGFSRSGYAEFQITPSEFDYAIINASGLVTLITVEQTTTGWSATHVTSAGC